MTVTGLQEVTPAEPTSLVSQARALVVTNQASYDAAGEIVRDADAYIKEVVAHFAPIKAAANKAHRAACDGEKKLTTPAEEAKRLATTERSNWRREQERIAAEAEAAARRAAQAQAEQEQLERAALLEREGRKEEAEAMIEQPVAVPAISAPIAPTPKTAGVVTRRNYKFRVVNKNLVKPAYTIPDEKSIGVVVRALKEAAAEVVGGIEVYFEETESGRA